MDILVLIITCDYLLVLAFCEMAPKLLALPGAKFLFSERLCQDPLESFFGKQRAIGKFNSNPTTEQYMVNCNILRIVHTLGLDPIRSNVRGQCRSMYIDKSKPLLRRKRNNST